MDELKRRAANRYEGQPLGPTVTQLKLAKPSAAPQLAQPGLHAAVAIVGELWFPTAAAGGGVSGTLAATELGADAFASTGTVLVQGTLAASESGADVFAGTGTVLVQGALAATETGSDAFSAAGTVLVQGTLAATETGSDTFASTGTVLVQGSLAATESGADTFAADGTVSGGAISGSLAATEDGSDTFAATGTVSGSEPPSTGGGGGGGLSSWYELPPEYDRWVKRLAEQLREKARKQPQRKAKKSRDIANAAEQVARTIAAPAVDPAEVLREIEQQQRFLMLLDWLVGQGQTDNELMQLRAALARRVSDDEEAIALLML